MRRSDLRDALRDAGEVDPAARERSWRVVRAACAHAAPAPRPRRRWRVGGAITALLLVVAGTATAAATAPRTGLGRWVRDVVGVAPSATDPALGRIPGGGRLLTRAGDSVWLVSPDGSRRRLGRYAGADWSPHGRFVLAWRDRTLSALDPRGRVQWSLAGARPITGARWGTGDGYRVAYLAGRELRLVNGDGTGDRRLAAAALVAPAWRPGAAHVLAYVDAGRRIAVVDVDGGTARWRSGPLRGLTQLAWSADGRRLLALGARRLRLWSDRGRLLASRATPAHTSAREAAWAPRGHRLAVVRTRGAGRGEVALLDADRGLAGRLAFTGPGRLGRPAWSPTGDWLLVPWPAADQWLFLRPRGGSRAAAVADIAAQFTPDASGPRFASDVRWCCAPA
jgi:hypothetical protein